MATTKSTWRQFLQSLHTKPRVVMCTFYPDTANPPTYTAANCKGVASITRSAQGTFLITLSDTYGRLISKQATIQMSSATDLVPQFGDISNVGTSTPPTIVIRANAVATATDIAANANNSISVTLVFDDSDV